MGQKDARRATDVDIERTILRLVDERGGAKSICPSEVARALAEDWRSLMPDVRAAAKRLSDAGLIKATQREQTVDVSIAKGALRLKRR